MNYQNLLKQIEKESLNSIELIKHTNLIHGFIEKDFYKYFTMTTIGNAYPDFINNIESKKLSKMFCSASKTFWKIRETLPKDVIQEFLTKDFLMNKVTILTNEDLKTIFRKYLGNDLIV